MVMDYLLQFSGLRQFAHEVYVLPDSKIEAGLADKTVNMFSALTTPQNMVLFWVFAALIAAIIVVAMYLRFKPTFKRIGASLDKTSSWALVLIRLAFGISLLFSVAYSALYGPELPLADFPYPTVLTAVLTITGIALTIGFKIRFFAIIAVLIWLFAFAVNGPYLFTYINYLGEALALILLPVRTFSIDGLLARGKKLPTYRYESYSLPVARILFAISLLYTAITIKFLSTALTLDVAVDFELARYLPFDPLFIVLGASMIEILVGLLFLFGLMQRFTAVIFLFVMVLSVLFFKEAVWPHLLIIVLGLGVLLHKPDRLTLDLQWLSKYKSLKSALLCKRRSP